MANQDLISPRFYTAAVENPAESKKQGRPIFEDKEFVEVKFAGDKLRVHVAPAHEYYKRRNLPNGDSEWITYAQEFQPIYERFKQGLIEQGTGTPLSELPFLTESKRAELKALNIKSAEALAQLDGGPLKMLGMGGRELKNQAQAYLDKANGSADVTRLAAENDAMRALIADLQKQMGELQSNAKTGPAKAGKATKASAAPARENDEPSPFESYEDDDIRNWLQSGGFAVEPTWTREELIAKADEANVELAAKKKVAA
ncbi:hypothetical protein EN866_33010 [Mesorhizobium sp. M2D.F.Ca.ET.223.01.1.1]|uniref:Ish1 domain-containing protein n=1 Tax=Mesorhizobium sp. M2D.F.Ca.ET.223.01.1.1 TaxID=2563940 RepID=UPI00109248D4|nr:Ish1 domain-containing protein [Mesorhizobium sp. M2D.F.Ca.ET.223.01.1.1]TGR84572.1 hypothetical protein EN866_33010 [Mesorhizobium sp. M2D.F.Ca.ET.223.01.1.1]TGT75171.1 hypothetical protein EN802_09200 [bacterium M00.F.Ca.ET.159.01.1.1]TGT88038.1 hypothetical protein EN800_06090 [bacterium M00.F.Ca.ET.157.01.1.1]